MTSLARDAQSSGAPLQISWVIPTKATLSEDWYFSDSTGAPQDISGLNFTINFRRDENYDNPEFSFSTSDYLSIVEDTDASVYRILRIVVPARTLQSYSGDYICDLSYTDSDAKVFLLAHGIATLRPNPA